MCFLMRFERFQEHFFKEHLQWLRVTFVQQIQLQIYKSVLGTYYLANSYLFNVSNETLKKGRGICPKLTIKTPEQKIKP